MKVTRTREEAEQTITDVLSQISSNPSLFNQLCRLHSECVSSKKGLAGDLDWFSKGKMHPEFEVAAFKLRINELSDVVESASGFHIILRIA